nr:CPBP family intramembrane glutamic endopeptidase [Natronobacterium texcoconense]
MTLDDSSTSPFADGSGRFSNRAVIALGVVLALTVVGFALAAFVRRIVLQAVDVTAGPAPLIPFEAIASLLTLVTVGLAYVLVTDAVDVSIDVPNAREGVIVGLGFLSTLLVYALAFLPSGELLPTFAGESSISITWPIVMIVYSLFIVAPAEEYFFRGVLQGRLRIAFGPGVAIALASVILVSSTFTGL